MQRKHKPQAATMRLPGRLAITLGLTLILLLVGSATGFAQEDPTIAGQVRAIEPDELGISNPAGLAFSPEANLFFVVRASDLDWSDSPTTDIILLSASPVIDQVGTVRVPAAIPDPINMAFDGQANRLLLYQHASLELIEIAAGSDGQLDSTTLTRHGVPRLDLRSPQGMTVDPASGRVFFLDSIGPRIVRIEPDPDGGFDGAAISRLDLVDANLAGLRGLAFNPANGHLYTLHPARQTLYEFTQGGRLVASHDASSLALRDSQGLVFAPSGDLTDDPSSASLYIADSGPGARLDPQTAQAVGGQIVEFSFAELEPLAVTWPIVDASLVRTIDTSAFHPPSPDPAGIVYLEPEGTLLMSDSEVDEMPMYFTGDNVFEISLGGNLVRTGTSLPDSYEPSGLAYDPDNEILFLTDDNTKKIWMVEPGSDGQFFTGDDPPRTFFSTLDFGCGDAEGITFDPSPATRALWLASGDDKEVFRVKPGGDGDFGTSDDEVDSWDTSNYAPGPGGIAFDPENGYLYLLGRPKGTIFHLQLDATDTLTVVREINISAATPILPAGATLAPGSLDPGVMNLYVVDRGIDNDKEPLENDGKLYEFYVPPLTADVALTKSVEPAVASPGETITYTLSFRNIGTDTAHGVVITDIIPPEVTVQSVYSSGVYIENSGESPPYVWLVQDLTTTDEGEIVVSGEVSPALSCFAPFTNTATIATASADTRTSNDSGSATVSVGAGVTVDPISETKPADKGTDVAYSLWITNTGTCSDTFDVSVSGTDWTVDVVDTVGELGPGVGASVAVTVSVPADAPCGPESATITFTSQGASNISASSELVTTVNPAYGVTVTPPTYALTGLPSEVLTYTLRMTNTGNCLETFDVSASEPNWITEFPPTVGPLYRGLGLDVEVVATVPPDALITDQDVVTMTFASQSSSVISDTSILTTSVGLAYGVEVEPTTAARFGDPNTGVTYTLQVTNTGNYTDTFTVSTSSDSWSASAQPTAVTLDPHLSTAVLVTVTVPANSLCDDEDHTTVTFTSESSGTISASSVLTTTANAVRRVKTLSGDLSGSGDPGSEVLYYDLLVQNQGNCTDILDISVGGTTWPVSTTLTAVELPPGDPGSVGVTVTVPITAHCGVEVATVTFTSRNDVLAFDSLTLSTTANAVSGLALIPPENLAPGIPSLEAAHSLWLTNTGNCVDTFTFSATGDEWTASTLSPTVTLDPNHGVPISVTVAVPSGAQCTDNDVATVTYTAENEVTVFASSTLTTTASAVPALTVTPTSTLGSGSPGLDAVYALQVTNTGNCADIFDFSAIGDDWPATTLSPTIALDPLQGVSVPVSVTVPSDALCTDSDSAEVIFTSRAGVTVSATSTLTTSASAYYGAMLDPSTASGSGDPGADATYTLWLTNTGNCAETFDFSAAGDEWTATTLSPTVTLDPHQVVTVPVSVTVPSNARCADSDSAEVSYTSRVDGTVSATSTLTTTANIVSALMLAPTTDVRAVSPGSDATYSLWLTNTGNCTDTFTIAALGDAWPTTAQPTLLELEAEVSASIAVTVAVPSSAQCGIDVATVTGTSFGGTASATSTLTTTASAVQGLTVTPSSEALSGDPGDPVVYSLSVTNDGNCADTFTFAASGNAWTTSAPSVGPVDPGLSASVGVTVTVHPDALCDAQDIVTATFTSAGDGVTASSSVLTTTANTVAGVMVTPPSAALPGDPGTGVLYTLWVTNTGNCTDTFIRSISGDTWPPSAPPYVEDLAPDAGQSFDVTVPVPLCSVGGVSDSATLTFKSQYDGTVAGSSTLTTTANAVAPVASDDPYDATEDLPLVVSAPGVLGNDDDANCTPLTVSHHTLPGHGMVLLDPDGSFTYTPTHNFDGIDSFTYYASDGVLTDTATVSITVADAGDNPIVSIEEVQDVNEGESVSFTGSFDDPQLQSLLAGESIHWDFGDGNTTTGTLTPTHTYLDNDDYAVTLTVTDTEGDVGQDWLLLTVLNVPPVVYAGPDQSAVPGEVLSFSGVYTDTVSDTLTIRWDLSDGSPPIHGTDTFNHAFAAAGDYVVILTVTDDDGGVGTDSAIVTVRYKVYLPLVLRSAGP